MAAAFSHNAVVVPQGTTIGQAINQEKDFEAKAEEQQAQADALKAQAEAAAKAAAAKMNHLITFAALSISILPKDIESERFSPELSVPFVIKNNTDKDIAGVKGTIEVQDIFGAELKKLNISADKTIVAHGQATMADYVWELNQFNNDDEHLMSVDLSKVRAVFIPSMVVFADGSKESVPDSE